jgi:hypothetical protein
MLYISQGGIGPVGNIGVQGSKGFQVSGMMGYILSGQSLNEILCHVLEVF